MASLSPCPPAVSDCTPSPSGGHPFEGGTELTESCSIEGADHLGGRNVAPFTGIHGWYWQNRTMDQVHLTLDASGKITGSKIFDQLGEHDRSLTPASE